MTYSKITLALSVTLLSASLAFAQSAKKTQTTTTESTSQNPATTTTTDSSGNTTQTTAADPASSDTTRTQTTTSEESEDKNKGGLFIEPMLTYEQGEVTLDYPAPFNSSTEDLDGAGLGLRFGGHVHEVLFLAADVRYSKPKYKSSALNGEADTASYNAGATLGVQTPVAGLRVWGTYILAGELDPEKIGTVDAKYQEMTGYRVGVGLYIKVVSINLEYQDAKFGKIEVNDGTTISNNLVDPKQKSYILSLSFPIAL